MTYRLNLDLPDENLEVFLRNIAPKVGTIRLYYLEDHATPGSTVNTTHKTEPTPAPAPESAPILKAKRKARRKPMKARGSLVNQTLLDTIDLAGQATIKQMKAALEAVGRAPSSLATGLAFLQREKVVERVGVGLYQRTRKHELHALEPDEPLPESEVILAEESPPTTDPLAAL